VKNFPHMAILHSFSKAYGMAGNRIGYIIAHPDIIAIVKNKTQWSNVSYVSVGAATIALDHEGYFTKMREDINQRRDAFTEFLKKSGYSVLPSKINAVLIKFSSEDEGNRFVEFLKQHTIVVSHGNGNSNIGLDKSFVRIAIGTKDQMKKLISVLVNF
ncbi:MAG: aminotransferase class I/II-fold pyridoxal phosphate-dependent enzyme, partial [archaeon]